jgi:hypothetical protein
MARRTRGARRTPQCLNEDNAVQVIDVFVDALSLKAIGFDGTVPAETGRPT